MTATCDGYDHRLLCAVWMYELHLESSGITAASLWALRHPGERLCWVRLCYGSCYGCCISQERINVSAVPMPPQLFFQTLNLCLAYPGFSRQCERQDNWHHKQGQQYKTQLQTPRAQIINIQKLSFENSHLSLLTVC